MTHDSWNPSQVRSEAADKTLTVGELLAFVRRCEAAGIPADTTVEATVTITGKLKQVWTTERSAFRENVAGLVDAARPFLGRQQQVRPVRPAQTRTPKAPPTVEGVLQQCVVEPPRHPLEEQVEVPNEQHHTKSIRKVFAEQGLPITAKGTTIQSVECVLVPEPWNEFDPNAVAVLVGSHQIGHLPGSMATNYQPALMRLASTGVLASGAARIWAKDEGGGILRARATLLIPEVDAFR